MSDRSRQESRQSNNPRFATTRWSVVLAAGKKSSPEQKQALETLCRSYWYPLYAYLRQRGCDKHQAEDVTQAFLAHILEKQGLRTADPQYGKFRSFLLVRLKGFLSDERDRVQAKKRGGGKKILSLGIQNAEGQYGMEPSTELSPEMLFEKSWALQVLERTMDRLEAEMAASGKREQFDHLKVYLTTDKNTTTYEAMATELGMSEGSLRVAVHRLRRLYRKCLRDEVAQTVSHVDQIDEEIGQLFSALAY
jgi:RNA polymerase sigma-70 factor (ECF subfamily)